MISADPLSRKQIQSVRLLNKRSERHKRALFIIEGVRAVEQALSNDRVKVSSIILEEEFLNSPEPVSGLYNRIHQLPDLPKYTASSSVFRQLSDTETTQGVMAVCHIPPPVSEKKLLEQKGIVLVADRIQDPGNMGTMIRTAVWFGICGMVVSPGTVDLFHPKVVRSTAGSIGMLPWMETDLAGFLERASVTGWCVYVLDTDRNAGSYRDVTVSGQDILVVGNEANGVAAHLKKSTFPKLRIDPGRRYGDLSGTRQAHSTSTETGVESLNVSVAAAIVMDRFLS